MAGTVSSRTLKGIGRSVSPAPAFGRKNKRAMVETDAAVTPTAADVGWAQAATCARGTIWSGRFAGSSNVEPMVKAMGSGGTSAPVSERAGGFRPGIKSCGWE